MLNTINKVETRTLDVTSKAGALLRSRYGLWVLGIISFVESSLLLPIITDPFMVAYILAHRQRTVAAVVVTTATSIGGAVVAYVTAAFFIDLVITYTDYSTLEQFNAMVESHRNTSSMLGFLGALTPIPFTLAALVAGALKANLFLFIVSALAGRIIRYGIIGYLTYKFGDAALRLARKHIIVLSIITFAVAIWWLWSL